MDQRQQNTQPQEPILTTRPFPASWVDELIFGMMPGGFTIVCVGTASFIASMILPPLYAFAFVFFVAAVPSYFMILRPHINRRIELRSSIYTLTQDHVEVKAQTGVFRRRPIGRSIPVSDIRYVRVSVDRILRDGNRGSVAITAFNSDSITFEDILDAEATGEIIRQSVQELTQRVAGNPEKENIAAWQKKHPTFVKAIACLCGIGLLTLLIGAMFRFRDVSILGLFVSFVGLLVYVVLMRTKPWPR